MLLSRSSLAAFSNLANSSGDFGQRWARTELHRIFVIYKKKAGVESKGGVHAFARHTPATYLFQRDAI